MHVYTYQLHRLHALPPSLHCHPFNPALHMTSPCMRSSRKSTNLCRQHTLTYWRACLPTSPSLTCVKLLCSPIRAAILRAGIHSGLCASHFYAIRLTANAPLESAASLPSPVTHAYLLPPLLSFLSPSLFAASVPLPLYGSALVLCSYSLPPVQCHCRSPFSSSLIPRSSPSAG
jgi:hypothetical protein